MRGQLPNVGSTVGTTEPATEQARPPTSARSPKDDRVPSQARLAAALALRPTPRALGLTIGFLVLTALGLASSGTGVVVLAGSLGVVLVLAPLVAWHRAHRVSGALRLAAHAEPSLVPVGGRCVLLLTARNASATTMPPVSIEPSAGRWQHTVGRAPSAVRNERDAGRGVEERVGPIRSPGSLPGARWLAPPQAALEPAPSLPSADAVETEAPVPTERRGLIELPPLGAWVHDPLGLFGVLVGVAPAVRVAVHPVPERRHAGNPALAGVVPADGGPVLAGAATGSGSGGGTGELADLRPYVPGDRLHLVHWPAFARHEMLVVRQFQPEVAATARLVLDDRAGVHRRADFEAAVSATLALADAALDRGAMVELGTLSGRQAIFAPTLDGRSSLRATLADVWPVIAPADPSRHGDEPYPVGATVVSTPTGAPTLPSGRWRPTIVVAP